MEFYEIQYNEALITRNLYSPNTYSFYYTNRQSVHIYFKKLEMERLHRKMKSFKKPEEEAEPEPEENENKENEMVGEEKNVEQTMDEETRKRLYEIRKQGSFMISDNSNNSLYEISF
jgi:hypothetical protein